jgi:hypothetical protein
MFTKKSKEREQTALERRVSQIATYDLAQWADNALFGIGRNLSSWQRSHSPIDLQEAGDAVDALQAVIAEMKKRA